MSKLILIIDAIINFILGVILLIFPKKLALALGVPYIENHFYPNILGATFIGITIALLIEYIKKPNGLSGLGLGGAIAINLSGGTVLALWLIFGNLDLPIRGQVFLWSLVVILIGISTIELNINKK